MTILENYQMIYDILNNSTIENKDELLEITKRQIDKENNRKAKAKERAEAKKEETAELTDLVESLLTTEPQTAIDILAQIEHDDSLTKGMIRSRLSALVKAGKAYGVEGSVEICGKKRRMMTYHK